MKKVLAVFAFAAVGAFAADYKGFVADASCAKDAAKAGAEGHAACAAKCIKGGAAAVLVTTDGKVYKIADQDKVTAHAGHLVTITGKLDGDTIKVDSVKM